jgi:hypothetical protein
VLRRRARHRHPDPAGLRFKILSAVLPALILAPAAAGCGGDDSSGDDRVMTSGPLVPSKRDYISEADGLCAFYETRVEELGRQRFGLNAKDFKVLPSGQIVFRAGRRPSDAAIEDFVLSTAVPELREQLEEVRAITPPAGDEAEVVAIYDSAARAVDGLEADPASFADDAAVQRLFAKARRMGRRYGLRQCGL